MIQRTGYEHTVLLTAQTTTETQFCEYTNTITLLRLASLTGIQRITEDA